MKTAEYKYEAKVAAIHKFRVNLKSLVAESRAIRQEEKRCGPIYRTELYLHRVMHLREEIRHTFLAYAFIRGRAYRQVEQTNRPDNRGIDVGSIVSKINKKMPASDLKQLRDVIVKWIAAPDSVS